MALSLLIVGIAGRMGKELTILALDNPFFNLIGGVDTRTDKDLEAIINKSHLNIPIETEIDRLAKQADIIIDFSSPTTLPSLLKSATKYKTPLVIGTTGYTHKDIAKIKSSSKEIAIFYSPNFSRGIQVLMKITPQIYSLLGKGKIAISDLHHLDKKDKPSGTALALAKILKKKGAGEVNIHSIRQGQIIGEHSIIFQTDDETIEIKHRISSRKNFAKGALSAAQFIANKQKGLYSLEDIFQEKRS